MTPERNAELTFLAAEMERWDNDELAHEQECMSCGSGVHTPSDLNPTPLCDLCAQRTAGELPSLIDEIESRDRLIAEMTGQIADRNARIMYLEGIINTPHSGEFIDALRLEAAHQIERWGTAHDAGKRNEDWVALVAYLLGKEAPHHHGVRGRTELVPCDSMKYRINTTITHEEYRGLTFLVDSLNEHLKEGLGTGDAEGDAQARAAASWVSRLVAVPVRGRRKRSA